jgi:ASC-1-like (ASCH) protein
MKKNLHELKIKEAYYNRVADGTKKCEIRLNDRDFQTGDRIHFYIDGEMVGKEYLITHVLHFPEGLKDGWVVLSIDIVK